MLLKTQRIILQEPEVQPKDVYLTADSVNVLWSLKDLFLKTRESAFIVHLQQLQSSAAVAHLRAKEEDRQRREMFCLSKLLLHPSIASRKPSLQVKLHLAERTKEMPQWGQRRDWAWYGLFTLTLFSHHGQPPELEDGWPCFSVHRSASSKLMLLQPTPQWGFLRDGR